MEFFEVRPEVAGGLGTGTVMDRSMHPPRVDVLHYVFEGWSGDVLVTSFPCYLVTSKARIELDKLQATGITFDNVKISKSETFNELFSDLSLPEFSWLKIDGDAGVDDFGISPGLRLVVSERVLSVLRELKFSEAMVAPFKIRDM